MFKNQLIADINIFKTNNLKLLFASIQGYLQLLWPTGRLALLSDLWQPSEGKWIISMLWHNIFLLYRHAWEIKLFQVFCWRYLTLSIQRQWLLVLLNVAAWNFRCWSLEQRNGHTLCNTVCFLGKPRLVSLFGDTPSSWVNPAGCKLLAVILAPISRLAFEFACLPKLEDLS